MCRKQWAAPCGALLFANADVTSSTAGSVTDSDSAVTTGNSMHCTLCLAVLDLHSYRFLISSYI